MVFGNKKSAAQQAEEKAKAEKYWQGDWVCKDCGYIYNRVRAFIDTY
jgi:rubrerythrin